jgi:hypothetical protein
LTTSPSRVIDRIAIHGPCDIDIESLQGKLPARSPNTSRTVRLPENTVRETGDSLLRAESRPRH